MGYLFLRFWVAFGSYFVLMGYSRYVPILYYSMAYGAVAGKVLGFNPTPTLNFDFLQTNSYLSPYSMGITSKIKVSVFFF